MGTILALREIANLVIIRATHVVAALGAHQLAMMSGKLMTASGTDLAMMIDIGQSCLVRFTVWESSGLPA